MCSWFTNGLGSNDTNRLTHLDIIASRQVTSIAHGTDTVLALAGNGRAKTDAGDAKLLNGNGRLITNETVLGNQNDVLVDDYLNGGDASTLRRCKHLVGKRIALLCDCSTTIGRHDVRGKGPLQDALEHRPRPDRVHIDGRRAQHDVVGCIPTGNLLAKANNNGSAVNNRLNG